jgi:protein TonB
MVVLRVSVRSDGTADAVKVISDPGAGFGQAARACALRTRFRPALDDAGAVVAAWSPPIRVRFVR